MLNYFNADDYLALDAEAQDVVDEWLKSHDFLDKYVTIIQRLESGKILVSGLQMDEDGLSIGDDIEIKSDGAIEDDFPWEAVEKSLGKKIKANNQE